MMKWTMKKGDFNMKHGLFAATVLALLAAYIFGGSAMASDPLEGLAGTWVEASTDGKPTPWAHTQSSPSLYRVIVNGDKLTLKEGDNVLVDTTFRVDTTYRRHLKDIRLFNIQMRENWQAYDGDHQHIGSFEVFDLFEYKNGALVGVVFIHDLGARELLFKRE